MRSVLLQFASAFERNDLAAGSKAWANDEALVIFEDGGANYGRVDFRDHHLTHAMASMQNAKMIVSDLRPHIVGSTAWATCKLAFSGDVKERHVESEALGTVVLEKREGRWQIVHWHSSTVHPHATPAPAH